jgi:small nuclear ribonucleoprotein B and B'
MSAGKKRAVLSEHLGRRVTLVTTDGERMDGRFLGYDKHMNVILADCERSRSKRRGGFEREALGFVVLRGEAVAALSVQRGFTTARTMVDTLKPGQAKSEVVEGERLTEVVRAARALRGGALAGLALN